MRHAVAEFVRDPYGRLVIALGVVVWGTVFALALTLGVAPWTAFIFANTAVCGVNIVLIIVNLTRLA